MGRFVAQVQAFALALGAPGLFLVALLDSSVLSLPEIADLLVIWMVTQHKHRFVLYAAAATLGSMAGCLVLYYLGKKGGDALIRRRFHAASVDRTMALFQRHGVLAVLIPSLLPPPAPFKIFVLLAGVADISAARFTTAIAIGRGSRYFVEALLALRYGDRAIEFVSHNGKTVSYAILSLIGIAIAAYALWLRSRKRPRARAGDRVQ